MADWFRQAALRQAPLLLVVVLLALTGGCSRYTYTLGTPLTAADAPDPAQQPSVAKVMSTLGPPQRLSATASGFIMAWEYWDIRDDSVGFRVGAGGADLVAIDWGAARARGTFLLANFDHDRQLVGTAITEWDSDAGGGRGIQPLFGFVSVTDVDDLLEDLPQHRWGMTSLKKMPASLNRDSDPDSGQAGLEQRGTPRNIGQNTLD